SSITDTDGDTFRSNDIAYKDFSESYDDSDGDGIPDYLDPNNIIFRSPFGKNLPLNALQQLRGQYQSYVMRTDPGLALRLGDIAFAAGSDSARVSVADIANFGDGEGGGVLNAQDILPNSGGYFDFEITNLPIAGSSARVVIPQFEPLPSGARYRKYDPMEGWKNFRENDNNALSSAPGLPGRCPAPGDAAYTPGLTVGDLCVQLIIEDGGPNDTDGIVNHVIEDPGQIGVVESLPVGIVEPPLDTTVNHESQATNSSSESQAANSSGGGIINLAIILGLLLLVWINLRRTRRHADDDTG
ncbi:hypothetical protein MNBD_GAMMA16-653, partial [hydrothermal vent metagenome]